MKKIALLMLVILSMATFTGCFGPPPANALAVSEEKIWPADMPSSVPKANESQIVKVTTMPNSVLIELDQVSADDYTAYVEQVLAAGWTESIRSGEQSAAYANGEARLDVTLLESKMMIDYSKSIKDTLPTKK